MYKIVRKWLRTGNVTEGWEEAQPRENFRGEIVWDRANCNSCGECARACPAGAIAIKSERLSLDSLACMYCGRCVNTCTRQALRHMNHCPSAKLAERIEEPLEENLLGRIRKIFGRSLAIRHLDCGSCNACDWEMAALGNPIYDLQQYGIEFVASPRHADLLMVTGTVTRNLEQALRMTYEAMPTPKMVMAVGGCAAGGGNMLGSSYALAGRVEDIVPVDVYVPGCPPRPQALLQGLLLLLDRL